MVLVRDLHAHVVCVHVWLRESFFFVPRAIMPGRKLMYHIHQAQLVPQLIINYKLKVRHRRHSHTFDSISARAAECRPYADEGDGVQDTVNSCR